MRKEGKNMVGMLQHLPKTVFFFKMTPCESTIDSTMCLPVQAHSN